MRSSGTASTAAGNHRPLANPLTTQPAAPAMATRAKRSIPIHPPTQTLPAGKGPAVTEASGGRVPADVSAPYAHEVVIRLTAIEDCWVEFTTPGGYLFQSHVTGARRRLGPSGVPLR